MNKEKEIKPSLILSKIFIPYL